MARALAADPPVLLMDEPFGAVDPVVRERLQNEFLNLQRTVRKTVLMVTHDIEEAVRLGDRVAVYGQGRIEQFDTPGAVLGTPATPYVARFVGADRGLKRLSVTEIEVDDLEQPPVARLDESAAQAAARLRGDDARWAMVLDESGDLHGWVGVDEVGLAGDDAIVGDLAHRMNAWVPVGAPLKQAFGVMLQHDAGWVAVVDGSRFVGVLTPAKLHEALRRSVDADAHGWGGGTWSSTRSQTRSAWPARGGRGPLRGALGCAMAGVCLGPSVDFGCAMAGGCLAPPGCLWGISPLRRRREPRPGEVERWAAGGGRWAAGGRRQAAGGRRQAAGGRRQAAGGRRQAAGGRRQAGVIAGATASSWSPGTSSPRPPAACASCPPAG
ncbi:CBS domain-containing protein [Streptomyces alboflavus]|uniref:CBS domain-containing protein n=1 Tax=Streptomyces alboflavus TaxID=67267 RepID=UPI0026CD0778